MLRRSIEVIVLGGAAAFLLRRVGHLGEVAGAFDHLHWHWLIVAVAAEACSMVALSWLQQRLLRVEHSPSGCAHWCP